jgi:hypothetical protein
MRRSPRRSRSASTGWRGRGSGLKKSSDRKHYSGKRKRHTYKTIVGAKGRRICHLGPSKRGARHDKRLLDQRHLQHFIPREVSILADSAFHGFKHPGMCLPCKARKKRPLSEEQRQWNKLLASERVVVEHAIGGMKRLAAVAGVYRNRKPKTHDRFNVVAAGIWNFLIA